MKRFLTKSIENIVVHYIIVKKIGLELQVIFMRIMSCRLDFITTIEKAREGKANVLFFFGDKNISLSYTALKKLFPLI